METGAFAMFDALGTKDVWENHDPEQVLRKFEAIATLGRDIVDGDFGGAGHPNTQDPSNFVKMVRLGFISDTVVIGFVNKEEKYPVFTIMMAARYAGEVARLGLEEPAPWAYRGVVTYGEFAMHESGSFYVGPAVAEAAAYYERAEAALIWLAPSTRAEMTKATTSDFQGAMAREEHDIVLKPGKDGLTSYRTYVASPFALGSTPAEASGVAKALLDTFDLTKPGVPEKRRNTEAFLQRHLKEHSEIWNSQQALLSPVRW